MMNIERCYRITEICLSDREPHTLRRIIDGHETSVDYVQQYIDDACEGNRIIDFACMLFYGLTQSNAYWTEERRRASLKIISHIDFSVFCKNDAEKILSCSLLALSADQETCGAMRDTFDGILIMLEGAPYFQLDPEMFDGIINKIDLLYFSKQGEEQDMVSTKTAAILNLLVKPEYAAKL